ncbi:MAG: Pesticin receptor [Immundisolibacter sp.]|nr:Pesticin receptor [Immundisolibacter sp.]
MDFETKDVMPRPAGTATAGNTQRSKRVVALLLTLEAMGARHGAWAEDAAPTLDNTDTQPAVTATPAKSAVALKKVTVTARRREEDAQDVPTPMSVLGGETLETQRIYRVQDIQQLAPSVNVAHMHARQSSISIRGLGNNPASDGLESSVGIYVDNVFLGRPGMAVFDLLDVEQIDVLRGPQGTLFGKNTTAGVLNITTRKPSFTPERSFEASGGQDGYFQGKGVLSGPLTDTLAGRLGAYRTRDDGYIKNVFNGDRLNGGEREGVRGQLLFEPSADLNVRWIGDYHEEDSSNGTRVLFSTGPTIGGINRYEQRAAAVGATLVDGRDGKVNIDGAQNVRVFQGGTSLEANWKLANDFTLTSVSAYRFWNFTPRNDDGLNVPVSLNAGQSVRDDQYSQELRLASPSGGRFDYVLGAYYFRQDLTNESFFFNGPLADTWNDTPPGALANVTSIGHGQIEIDSYALFAQGTWHLTERLDLTAGARGTYESKDARVDRDAPVGGAPVAGPAAAARNGRYGAYDSGDLGLNASSPSGLLSLGYRFTPQVLGYASVSHGEKSGGIDLSVSAAPTAGADSLLVGAERANDAEMGVKSVLFDRRLLLNTNVFWSQVNGYQTLAFDDASFTRYLTNAGSVRTRGLEFEATALPLRGLTLSFNGSYNDATYLSYKDAPCPPEIGFQPGAPQSCDLTGRQVVGAPKWIANLSGDYRWRAGDGLQHYLAASYAFRSSAPGTLDDSKFGQIPSYAVVNLSTGVRVDLGKGQLDLSLWLKNAFDKTYYTILWNEQNGGYGGLIGTPRTLGVSARYDF